MTNAKQRPPREQQTKDLVPCLIWLEDNQREQVEQIVLSIMPTRSTKRSRSDPSLIEWEIDEADQRIYVSFGNGKNGMFVQILASDPPSALARKLVKAILDAGCHTDEVENPRLSSFLDYGTN